MLKRLREARDFLGLSQPVFAEQIEITRERLANYETGRTPLPCDLAMRICNQFILGERWLATGRGPVRQYLALAVSPKVFRLPYGQAYDASIAEEADALAAKFEAEGTLFAMSPVSYWNPKNRQFYRNFFNAILDNWMTKLEAAGKTEDIGELIERLVNSGQAQFEFILDRELKHDLGKDEFYWVLKSTGERRKMAPPETPERKAQRVEQRTQSNRIWDMARKVADGKPKAEK